MPESLLTILKFCFLAVLYLFFFRVLRAVWSELGGARAATVPVAQAPRRTPSKRSSRGGRNGSRLKVIEPAARRGETYELGDELTLGRATGCQVTVEDNYVSQLHARVFRREGQFYIEDLGSTNGTYLNRKKVSAPIAIRRGDRLQVGRTVLELN